MSHAVKKGGFQPIHWFLICATLLFVTALIIKGCSDSAEDDDAPFSPNARVVGGLQGGNGGGGGSETNPPATPVPAIRPVTQVVAEEEWPHEVLTSETKSSRPQGVEGSDEVVAWLMDKGASVALKFDKPGDRTGWVYHPGGSFILFNPEDGVKADVAPGYGTVPGEWVRWQRTKAEVQGVTVQVISLGPHRR